MTPDRAPASVRRTASVDMRHRGGPSPALVLVGSARDLVTSVNRVATPVATAFVRAEVGSHQRLTEIATTPHEPRAASLVGRVVGSGFRRAVDRALPEHAEHGTLLHLLLDDLPVAALIASYSLLHRGRRDSAVSGPRRRPSPDVCAGWRTGGSAMLAYSAGLLAPLNASTAAPPLAGSADPLAWHVMGILGSQEMRRCRRIDVVAGEDLLIDAMFRDTYIDPDGVERVLHEYSMTARADRTTLAVTHIEAVPHTLPHLECVDAAASALVARGVHLPMLRNVVEQTLYGPASCTHLNDLLRSLADAGNLAALASGARAE
jgi:DUF2889 family protein